MVSMKLIMIIRKQLYNYTFQYYTNNLHLYDIKYTHLKQLIFKQTCLAQRLNPYSQYHSRSEWNWE